MGMAWSGAPEFANLTADGEAAGSAEMQAALLARAMDRAMVWDNLKWLRQSWPGPLVLKGVLHPDDARLAIDHGVDGLIVSNHGGRQLDASPSAISALPSIAKAVSGRIPLFLDSGIRRGGDIAKAIALGADAVFLGRPLLYGLAAGGQAGVESVLKQFSDDFMRTMILLGASRVSDLRGMAA